MKKEIVPILLPKVLEIFWLKLLFRFLSNFLIKLIEFYLELWKKINFGNSKLKITKSSNGSKRTMLRIWNLLRKFKVNLLIFSGLRLV